MLEALGPPCGPRAQVCYCFGGAAREERCAGFRAAALLPPLEEAEKCRLSDSVVSARNQRPCPVFLNSGLLMLESSSGIFDHPNTEPQLPHASPSQSYTHHNSTESAQQPCGAGVFTRTPGARHPAQGSAGLTSSQS